MKKTIAAILLMSVTGCSFALGAVKKPKFDGESRFNLAAAADVFPALLLDVMCIMGALPGNAPDAGGEIAACAGAVTWTWSMFYGLDHAEYNGSGSGLPYAFGPIAECSDFTWSYSASCEGTCSYHGGVMQWTSRGISMGCGI